MMQRVSRGTPRVYTGAARVGYQAGRFFGTIRDVVGRNSRQQARVTGTRTAGYLLLWEMELVQKDALLNQREAKLLKFEKRLERSLIGLEAEKAETADVRVKLLKQAQEVLGQLDELGGKETELSQREKRLTGLKGTLEVQQAALGKQAGLLDDKSQELARRDAWLREKEGRLAGLEADLLAKKSRLDQVLEMYEANQRPKEAHSAVAGGNGKGNGNGRKSGGNGGLDVEKILRQVSSNPTGSGIKLSFNNFSGEITVG